MTPDQYAQWVCRGELPRHAKGGQIDLHTIDRALRGEQDSARRIALLKRVLEFGALRAPGIKQKDLR